MAVTGRTVCRVTLVCLCALALVLALSACGSTRLVQDAYAHADALAGSQVSHAADPSSPGRITASVRAAQQAYNRETKGFKLHRETDRIARDPVLLAALARGNVSGAQAEARAQLLSPSNHFDHVTRISV